jgi:hypothetical protein
MVDAGAYPVDAHLDHFLAVLEKRGDVAVYYIDLERVRFGSVTARFWRRRKLIKTVGRLTARLEWLRLSDGGLNRAAILRIGRAFFGKKRPERSNKALYGEVLAAARKFWDRREFHKRGTYGLRSFQPTP